MLALLTWFARRPVVTALLTATYFAVVVASHDHVQEVAYWLQRTFTREIWTVVVAVIAVACAVAAAWRVVTVCRARALPRGVAIVWWGSLTLASAASLTLLATNMETVHFLQYALLALPVLALTRRFGATVLVVTVLGAFDELNQWAVLHSGWGVRFDTNDVLLNAIGAALGCAAAAVFAGTRPAPPPRARALAATWAPLLVVALLLGAGGQVLAAEGRLALYREDWSPRTWLTLSRDRRPVARWQRPENSRAHYVTHPGAALALCLVILAAFAALEGALQPAHDQSGSTS